MFAKVDIKHIHAPFLQIKDKLAVLVFLKKIIYGVFARTWPYGFPFSNRRASPSGRCSKARKTGERRAGQAGGEPKPSAGAHPRAPSSCSRMGKSTNEGFLLQKRTHKGNISCIKGIKPLQGNITKVAKTKCAQAGPGVNSRLLPSLRGKDRAPLISSYLVFWGFFLPSFTLSPWPFARFPMRCFKDVIKSPMGSSKAFLLTSLEQIIPER